MNVLMVYNTWQERDSAWSATIAGRGSRLDFTARAVRYGEGSTIKFIWIGSDNDMQALAGTRWDVVMAPRPIINEAWTTFVHAKLLRA